MLGGDPESDVSRAHARELLESAAAPAASAAIGPEPKVRRSKKR
jgi:hypothetical protein